MCPRLPSLSRMKTCRWIRFSTATKQASIFAYFPASFEKSADDRKKAKDRVTINACSNASGTIKLPLQLIGKSKRPRCFKGVKMDLLPLKYSAQKNACMDEFKPLP